MKRIYSRRWRGNFTPGFVVFLLFLSLGSTQFRHSASAGQSPKSDPCRPTEEIKAFMKKTPGTIDPDLVKCVPLEVTVTWDAEETYVHGTGETDSVKLKLEERFPARLELWHNPLKRSELGRFLIEGPSPCCPGEASAALLGIQARLLACTSGEHSRCKSVVLDDPLLFDVNPRKDSSFTFTWSRDGEEAEGGIGSSAISLRSREVEQHHFVRGRLLVPSRFQVKARGNDAFSWEEIKEGLEREELATVFPVLLGPPNPRGTDTHRASGQVTVHIRFGEQEEERWRVRVEAQEVDFTKPAIEYKDPQSKETKRIDIRVRFAWQLEGEFSLRKFKKGLEYKEGRVTKSALSAQPEIEPNDLFRCSTVGCGSEKFVEEGDVIEGTFSGRNVRLTWPSGSSAVCVVCNPRMAFLGKAVYQQQFGLSEFMPLLSKEVLPLRSGYVKSGGAGDWLKYTITLTKID